MVNHDDHIDPTKSKLDFACCLYATSPFVEPEDLQNAINVNVHRTKLFIQLQDFLINKKTLKRDLNGNTFRD